MNNRSKVSTEWTKDLPADKKDKYIELIKASVALEKQREILERWIETKVKDSDDYDCPSWAYKQADKVGYRRALKEVIDLITVN